MLKRKTIVGSLVLALGGAACAGPQAVRGDDVEGLDDDAMSTSLDRKDLQKMLNENMDQLQSSRVVTKWQSEERPTVAVLPIINDTTEHIDSSLQALISDVETRLVNAGHVQVIAQQDQGALIEEIRRQQTDAFDPTQTARWGKQMGARYFITGKVYSVDERQEGERRVQYFLFMRVIEAETGALLWQNKSSVTKALIN